MNAPRHDHHTLRVRDAIDVLDEPRPSMSADLLRRIGQRVPAELKAAYELVWMRRVTGLAAALFLALFAAERFDVVEDEPIAPIATPAAVVEETPLPAWMAMEQGRREAEDGAWLMDALLIGGMDQ